jgi:hypothetical protein
MWALLSGIISVRTISQETLRDGSRRRFFTCRYTDRASDP